MLRESEKANRDTPIELGSHNGGLTERMGYLHSCHFGKDFYSPGLDTLNPVKSLVPYIESPETAIFFFILECACSTLPFSF